MCSGVRRGINTVMYSGTPLPGRPDSYGLDHTVKRTRITRMHADLFRLIASEFLCFNPRDQRSSASRFKKYIVTFMESRTKFLERFFAPTEEPSRFFASSR